GRQQRLEWAAGFPAPLRRGTASGTTPGQVVPVGGVVLTRSPGRDGAARLVAGVPVDVYVGGRLGGTGRPGGTAEARRPGPVARNGPPGRMPSRPGPGARNWP